HAPPYSLLSFFLLLRRPPIHTLFPYTTLFRSKIITKELAQKHGFAKDYPGPLTKTDAQRVLEALIAEDTGAFVAPDREATVAKPDRKSTRLNSSHVEISYAVFCLKKKKNNNNV